MTKPSLGIKVSIDYENDTDRNAHTWTFDADELVNLDKFEAQARIPEIPALGFFYEWKVERRGQVLKAQITAPHFDKNDRSSNRTLKLEVGMDSAMQFISKALLDGNLRIEAGQISELLIALGNALKDTGQGKS